MRVPAIICAGLLLTACVHPGRPEVASIGEGRPQVGSSFVLIGSGPDGAVPAPWSARVSGALQAAGLRPADSPETADYLVHVSWAVGSSKVGAFIPPAEEAKDAAPDWRVKAAPGRPWSALQRNGQNLTLDVVERATGKEVRRIAISRRSWSADPDKAALRIADALETSLKP